MITCSPQRYLANNRNELLDAVLTPSSVAEAEDLVRSIPNARIGTAQAMLSGAYSGAEEATYDLKVIDDLPSANLISAPVFSGAGSGSITNISVAGAPQNYTVELHDSGIPEAAAFVDFEGVKIVARIPGDSGNDIRLLVDQSGLSFSATDFSLLDDLAAGSGADTAGLEGAAFDWDTAVIGSDNQIPASAHRVAFGDDTSVIYLSYKRFDGTKWTYHFSPEIKKDVRKGTAVKFVTGGRDVTVTDGTSPSEDYTGIVTVYDLLFALKTESVLVDVAGVVANDRAPGGQAARELSIRTDAHAEQSYGSGSPAATGFDSVTVAPGAGTELVTATCFAISSKDNPNATVGMEMWRVRGSLSGELATTAVTGVPYTGPDWGFTIPRRLPDNYGAPKGRFSVEGIDYVSREGDVDPLVTAPICVRAMELGPEAQDQSISLVYTARPSGDCLCDSMPVPNLRTACLGVLGEGGPTMGYREDTNARLVALYDWQADTIRANSFYGDGRTNSFEAPMIGAPLSAMNTYAAITEPLHALVANFESVLAEIDAIDPGPGSPTDPYQEAGFLAWDVAFSELQADVAEAYAGADQSTIYDALENLTAGNAVCTVNSTGGVVVRKAVAGGIRYGFVTANVTAGNPAIVFWYGDIPSATGGGSFAVGTPTWPNKTVPGAWTQSSALVLEPVEWLTAGNIPTATSASDVNLPGGSSIPTQVWYSLLADRYESRLLWVGMSANIPQVGKSDADSVTSGDGCWRDTGDAFYWEIVGSEGGKYAPVFNNVGYYSSRLASDGKKYFSTHEFAFILNIKCPGGLMVGDRITLSIGGSGFVGTYQVGDILSLPIIAAQPFALAGGQDPDDTQRWFVTASVDGPLAQFTYLLSDAPPLSYSDGGLLFDIELGGIPFAKGDKFTFGVEGGHFQWRKNAGSWSATLPISLAPSLLDAGLSLTWTPGAEPSFVADDVFKFRALQPWAVSNILTPNRKRWQWIGDTVDLIADLGSVKTLDMTALALHTLPEGATIEIQGGSSPGVYLWAETLTRREKVIFDVFTVPHSARYVKLSMSGVQDAEIGWWWIGEGMGTELSSEIQITRSFKFNRQSSGARTFGKYLGKATGGSIEWVEGAISEIDRTNIEELVAWIKEHDDEPMIVVPQITRPDEAMIAQIVTDDVDMVDMSSYNRDVAFDRRFSARLPLAGFW